MHKTADHILKHAPLRYRVSRKLNLFLAKTLKVSRLPAIRMARTLNLLARPVTQVRRRRMATAIRQERARTSPAISIDRNEGFALIPPAGLAEVGPAIRQAMEIYRQSVEAEALRRVEGGTSRKNFLMQAVEGAAMNRHHDIMRLALARPLLDAVSDYLGEVPIVGNITLMISMPNDSQVGSQLYHLDFADERQVKLFVHVDDVAAENGPFTFTPVSVTDKLIKTYGYDRGRLTIEQVRAAVGPEKEIQLIGPAGTALLCDTSRCLHYGSNRNTRRRIVLLIQYVAHAVPEQPPAVWPVEKLARDLGLDETQRLALTV